jgi:monofunctional glycosyltransferase
MPAPLPVNSLRRALRLALSSVAALALVWLLLVAWHMSGPASSTLIQSRLLWNEPVDQRWRPLESLSPHLARAVVAAEDQRFCAHNGVDWEELRAVLGDEDGPSRGASTLTMQTVKNLYLWPGRSYLRKALEIPMAVVADAVWSKRRTLEIYLNVAEWGEGIFGAEAAAQRFFGKGAQNITAAEAARLAAALPNPRLSDPRSANSASRRIAQRMVLAGGLTDCVE